MVEWVTHLPYLPMCVVFKYAGASGILDAGWHIGSGLLILAHQVLLRHILRVVFLFLAHVLDGFNLLWRIFSKVLVVLLSGVFRPQI
jgi:hypothetical protein